MGVDPSRLLVKVAELYGADDDSPANGSLTKIELYDGIKERITQAAQDSEQNRQDERRQSTPIRLVREAGQKIARARDAVTKLKSGAGVDHEEIDSAVRQVHDELHLLSEVNKVDA